MAKGLTWGQISRQLPHRKRATCFNRYRTLQGIRKSRSKRPSHPKQPSLPPTPPPTSPSTTTDIVLPSPRQILMSTECYYHVRLAPLLAIPPRS